MDKITLIATFVNEAGRFYDLERAKLIVIQDFKNYKPGVNINTWNTDLPQHIVDHYLKTLQGANDVRTKIFIDNLTFPPS